MPKHKNLETFEGHKLRLNLTFTDESGTSSGAVSARVRVEGVSLAATVAGNVVEFAPMPCGQWLYAVHVGEKTVLHGHACVARNAYDAPDGAATDYSVAVGVDDVNIEVTLSEGPKGICGDDGESAYEIAVKNGFAGSEHEWLDSLRGKDGVSAEDLEEMLTASYEVQTFSTPTANSNATCNYIELDPARVPTGLLTEISYRTGTNTTSGMTTAPMWLAVWELAEGSTTEYHLAGVSTNTVTQAINSTLAWSFDTLPLHGRRLRLIPTTDPAQTEEATCEMRIRTSTSTDSTKCVLSSTAHNFTPRLDILALCPKPRFAPASHAEDADLHLTEAQRQVLSCFEWSSTHGVAFVHKTTDGATDNKLSVVISTTGTTLMTSGTLTFQAAQAGIITRTAFNTWTDSSSGTSYNYGGHTMSESDMQPYGITEPCVWCGDPALPLLLRGSEIRLNGTAINVETLIQLLGNANALLALIDPIDG